MPESEKTYSVLDLSVELGISTSKALRIAKAESGVLNHGTAKRGLYRVPQSVLDRIKKRSTKSVLTLPLQKTV